jgi:hypothetical protein
VLKELAEEESAYSEQARRLLELDDGSMPDAITKLDAQLINTICNEIIETSGSIRWDDIAGAPPLFPFFSASTASCDASMELPIWRLSPAPSRANAQRYPGAVTTSTMQNLR